MFNKEKQPSEKNTASATIISAGTILHGDLTSDNDLRIDGTIHGNVTSTSRIVVGPSGFIEGNLNGRQADITGRVVGHITVHEILQLRSQANVQGNIQAVTLQIDPSAIFNGQCQMGEMAHVVSMNVIDEQTAEAK